jgi:hypothetical protein
MRKCGGGGEDTVSVDKTEVLSDVNKHACSRMLTYADVYRTDYGGGERGEQAAGGPRVV